jgi:hypothetical protein
VDLALKDKSSPGKEIPKHSRKLAVT